MIHSLLQRFFFFFLIASDILFAQSSGASHQDNMSAARDIKILVYGGEGVSAFSLSETLNTLQGISQDIEVVDHHFLIENDWEKETKLIIFPGGRDIPYDRNLKGKGLTKIRNFIEEGGSYLGICAGAYFAAQEVVFEEGTELEVCEKRDLGFFPNAAVGTIYPHISFSYKNEGGAYPSEVSFKGSSLYLYYNGGCTFRKVEEYPFVKTLAYFLDAKNQPAIIHLTFGKGNVVLSGVHFEMSATSLESAKCDTTIVNKIKKSDAQRQDLIITIFSYL